MPSPHKPQGLNIMLPSRALEVNTTTTMAPSPMSWSTCTPQNAASTHWRTVVCPNPPAKHNYRRSSMTLDTADGTSSGGLRTPATQWPSPAGTPTGTPTAAQTPRAQLSFGFGDDCTFNSGRPQPSPTGSFGFSRRLDVHAVRTVGPTVSMGMRLQTITDASPKKMNASGYTSGLSDMDVSMEASQDMVTPSPDHDKRQAMLKKNEMSPSPVELPKSGLFGPDSPNGKPYAMSRSEQFRCPIRTPQMQNLARSTTQ